MRLCVGVLLVIAAGLKAVELLREPAAASLSAAGVYAGPAQIGIELGVGLLALTGIYWTRLRWFSLLLFSSFAAYSLYLIFHGDSSCNCFGPVKVHPRWVFFLDCAIVVGLVTSILKRPRSIAPAGEPALPFAHSAKSTLVLATIACASVLVAAFLVQRLHSHAEAASDVNADEFVVLEPDQWIGKRLPIADVIDIDVTVGEWTAVLHRHDCPECRDALPRYEQLASAGRKVALIEVPPYGGDARPKSACVYGRLKDDRDWFVQTPTEIVLSDGVVTAVTLPGE